MKYVLVTVAANLVSLACVSSAFYLLLHGTKGWGWFLFVGALAFTTPKIGTGLL